MNIEFYFPTPLWWEQTQGLDVLAIEHFCKDLRSHQPEGRKLSNQGGWQSIDFLGGTFPILKDLENKILTQAHQCVRDYGYAEDRVFVSLGNMWVNINEEGNTNSVHIHDDSFISGVFYVKAQPGQGNINFYKCFSHDYIVASQAPIDHYTLLSASAMSFEPMTGKLILFPGYLPHGVERNNMAEERISISFNVKLLRKDDAIYWSKNT